MRPRLVLPGLLALIMSAPAIHAQAGDAPVAFILPVHGPREDYATFARSIATDLGFEPEYVLGPGTPNGLETRTEDDHTIVLSWLDVPSSEGRRVEVRQAVQSTSADGNYKVAPEDLHQGVEVWAGGALVRLTAPPGVLPKTSDEFDAAAEALARSVGVPPADPSTWTSVSASDTDALRLFQEAAPAVPGFYLSCDCTILTRHDEGLSPNLNLVRVTFTKEATPVAIEFSPWADLERSRILPKDEASRLLADALRERGTLAQSVEFERIEIAFDAGRLLYEWRFLDSNSALVRVSQDAHNGSILATLTPEMPAVSSPETAQRRAVPAPAGTLLGGLAVACLILAARGRNGA